ncbi:MAG TPA: hypothetical protein PKU93_00565 [Candidatus Pacearchaeota archaeon]|nr:hypothetical protein [Candidatus Pacearchaeota archaeon]
MRNLNSSIDKENGPYRIFITNAFNDYGIAKKIDGEIIRSISSKNNQQEKGLRKKGLI